MNREQKGLRGLPIYKNTILALFFSSFLLLGCPGPGTPDPPNTPQKYTVSFNANGGTGGPTNLSINIESTLSEPESSPSRADEDAKNYYFGGWYTTGVDVQQNGSSKYKFGTPLNSDLSLYARWYTEKATSIEQLRGFLSDDAFSAGKADALNFIDVRQVTDMSGLIKGLDTTKKAAFNVDISRWDTSAVTDMSSMFEDAIEFNQNIAEWDTSSVTSMASMFRQASKFNRDISRWDTSALTNMDRMFQLADAFNQNIGSWNTSAVTSMKYVFEHALSFDGNIGSWKTGSVTDMFGLFFNASAFNQDIGSWDTSAVTNMGSMFTRASAFNQNLTGWVENPAGVSVKGMFDGATAMSDGNKATWMTATSSPTS